MFTLVSLCSAAVIRLYCWSVLRREVRWGEAGTSCVRMSWSKGDFRDRSPERKTVCKTWCNTVALCAHRDGRRQIWEKSSRWTNIFIMYCNVTPIKISNLQPSLRNFVNFVAVACEKQLDSLFQCLTFWRSPPWRWLCAPCGSLCDLLFFFFHPSPVFLPSLSWWYVGSNNHYCLWVYQHLFT